MPVQSEIYHFKIGNFECSIIRDTLSPMKLEHFFPNLPVTYLQQLSNQYEIPPIEGFEVLCLLIKTGKHTVLIDTGWGSGTQPNSGKLIQNLQAEGVKCQEIDRIIITHGHPDHIGGNIDSNGKSVFSKARYYIFRKEWEFWASGTDLIQAEDSIKQNMITTAQKRLLPLRDQIELVDTETEILPGIKFIMASGHTPGQGVLVVSSGTDKLLCISDLFHHPLLLAKPDLHVTYDTFPKDAITTRTQILSQFVTPELLVFACHFTFPGLGRIEPKGNGWLWKPIEFSLPQN